MSHQTMTECPKMRLMDSFTYLSLLQLHLFLEYHAKIKTLLPHPTLLLSLQRLAFSASPFQASTLFEHACQSRIRHSKPVIGAHAFSFHHVLPPHSPRAFRPAVTPKDPCFLLSFRLAFHQYPDQPQNCSRYA